MFDCPVGNNRRGLIRILYGRLTKQQQFIHRDQIMRRKNRTSNICLYLKSEGFSPQDFKL
jgi:hypothetical protein